MNQKLIKEINFDLDSMSIIVSDIETLINEVGDKEPNNILKTALGGLASQFYNGVENILKRIHKYYKIEIPYGDDWHLVLLDRFAEDSNFEIPIKLNRYLINKLTEYRRFRHYFFHGYGHNLIWNILVNGVKDIRVIYDQLKKEIFCNQEKN